VRENNAVQVLETDLLVVGAGPSGSAAATWAARHGLEVTIIDKEKFPRDKPCGDGLTPRAINELTKLGLSDWLTKHPKNIGLRAAGFGQELLLPWPGGSLPSYGSAAPRMELDQRILQGATDAGAKLLEGYAASEVVLENGRLTSIFT